MLVCPLSLPSARITDIPGRLCVLARRLPPGVNHTLFAIWQRGRYCSLASSVWTQDCFSPDKAELPGQ